MNETNRLILNEAKIRFKAKYGKNHKMDYKILGEIKDQIRAEAD